MARLPRDPARKLQHAAAARRRRATWPTRCGASRASTPTSWWLLIDSPEVVEAYRADKDETRKAAGSAAELQGKTATTDGPVRFTAPSIVFEQNGTRLVAGGFQPVEAYDILVANLDPELHREPPPETPAPCSSDSRRPDHAGGRGADGARERQARPGRPPRRRCSSWSAPAKRSAIRSATMRYGRRRPRASR